MCFLMLGMSFWVKFNDCLAAKHLAIAHTNTPQSDEFSCCGVLV